MKFLMGAVLAGVVAAHPKAKTCVTQAGSNANGVPVAGTDFTAMSATWTQDLDLDTDVFTVANGKLSVNIASSNYGAFIIAETGTVGLASGSSYSSVCTSGCDRLACIEGIDGAIDLELADSNSSTCAAVTLVVGYAEDSSTGNTLKFASVNMCDTDDISITAYTTTTTTTTDSAATTAVAAAAGALAVVAHVLA